MRSIALSLLMLVVTITANATSTGTSEQDIPKTYWMKIKANNKFERSYLANQDISIEMVDGDYVIALGNEEQYKKFKKSGKLLTSFEYNFSPLDFPPNDSNFHNYAELKAALMELATTYPTWVELSSIGRSHEGRDIFALRITDDVAQNDGNRPGIIFMGGHHAREHVSIEIPYMLAQHILRQAKAGDQAMLSVLRSRELHIIPVVNPDGAEYDIESGRYKMWRKNRRVNGGGTYGVDLNRNYSYGWGTGGSSTSPNSDVYMGPAPFSEPETIAIKNYVEATRNISILLSFHTFSELILYPWGGKYEGIENERDRLVHEKMATKMATWNNYKPQQASDLYIASGDTTDWAYGTHRIISFTFELDPKSQFNGGFYPGQGVLPAVFAKNLNPALYLIDHADNPYRVIDSSSFGLKTSILE